MRDGNNFFSTASITPSKFEAYLWGMETVKTKSVSIPQLMFEAYLWGMETGKRRELTSFLRVCLKPTYEGWKRLSKHFKQRLRERGLKPTYEGWKLFKRFWNPREVPGLKPTYEGWKLPKVVSPLSWLNSGLKPTYEGWKRKIEDKYVRRWGMFEAYLWGMETILFVFVVPFRKCLKPTYEGWKLALT